MVLVWDENGVHVPLSTHPLGVRGTVAKALMDAGVSHEIHHLDEPEAGLPDEVLDRANVLIWWGHARHHELPDGRAEAIVARINSGNLALLVLHSGHQSKVVEKLFGAKIYSKGGYDEDPQAELVTVCAPQHPICQGIEPFEIDDEEFYGAPATFPQAETVLLQSFFPKYGRHYPSGLTWTVGDGKHPIERSGSGKGQGEGEGAGRVAYLRFGHETSRSLAHPMVQKLIVNAVRWLGKET